MGSLIERLRAAPTAMPVARPIAVREAELNRWVSKPCWTRRSQLPLGSAVLTAVADNDFNHGPVEGYGRVADIIVTGDSLNDALAADAGDCTWSAAT